MLDKSKKSNLKELKDKCLLFNQFMIEKGGLPLGLAEYYKESNNMIEKAFAEGNPKPLNAMNRDIDKQVLKHMPLAMAKELKKMFEEKLGINFEAFEKDIEKAIEKVVWRGKISNKEEYELLLNKVDEIYEDHNQEIQIRKINDLLVAYHS